MSGDIVDAAEYNSPRQIRRAPEDFRVGKVSDADEGGRWQRTHVVSMGIKGRE
jgi:hypothetical protein